MMAELMLLLERHEVLRQRAMRAFRNRPSLFARMLAMHVGAASPLDVAGKRSDLNVRSEKLAAIADLLRGRGATLTPRSAVILGDSDFLRQKAAEDELIPPQDGDGWLLGLAVDYDRPEILKLLLELGLDGGQVSPQPALLQRPGDFVVNKPFASLGDQNVGLTRLPDLTFFQCGHCLRFLSHRLTVSPRVFSLTRRRTPAHGSVLVKTESGTGVSPVRGCTGGTPVPPNFKFYQYQSIEEFATSGFDRSAVAA